jgi:signal transduction histidine kinase
MIGTRASDLAQAKRLERGLILVRWFGVVLGLYLVSQTNVGTTLFASNLVLFLAYTAVTGLAVANGAVWYLTNRATTQRQMAWIGVGAFAVDAAVILSLAWVYSYSPTFYTWVVIYILPLEGAIRYRLEGALAAVVITLVSETGREAYQAHRFGSKIYPFLIPSIALRVGIDAIIALVAGYMARSLAREAERAAEQAVRFEQVARREADARREVAAFNTAILSGVAVEDFDQSIQQMAEAVGRDLGFETFAILLMEGERLLVKGMYGMDQYGQAVPVGAGITGRVAATNTSALVPDVSLDPDYIPVDAAMRSEMAAPMRIGGEVVGVVDVESRLVEAFDEDTLALLTRLADQIALVVRSAQLHAQQKETLERLQELDKMKSDFVAIASHELRTPLTAIHGYVKTLIKRYDQLSPTDTMKFLETISRQSDRMTRLVEDLLLVSKIEGGAIRLVPEESRLSVLVEGVLESLGPERRARMEVDVVDDGRPVVLDPHRVDQIIRNLVGNAMKFSPHDSKVTLHSSADDGHVTFVITDRGVGIPESEQTRIFDRFHQASDILTREAEGAGLGLYITKQLVEAMGGTIGVRSTVGDGSTFTVVLPRGLPAEAEAEAEPGAGSNGQVAPADRSDSPAAVRS